MLPRMLKRHVWNLIASLAPLALTLALYWPTLSQPYFWDDAVHFGFATTRSFAQIWLNGVGYAYYRPVTFTLYKVLFELLPPGHTTFPHLLILCVHSANAWLVGWLTCHLLPPMRGNWTPARLETTKVAGLLASLMFASYPFAALPMSHFAAIMHPLMTFFVLVAIVAALKYVLSRRRSWLAVSLGTLLLAPFTHESGIMAGFVVALILLLRGESLARRDRRLLVVLPSTSAAFLPVWLAIPKNPTAFRWFAQEGLLAKVTFFLQGPTYPLQPLSRLLIDHIDSWDKVTMWTTVGLPWWSLAVIWLVAGLGLVVGTLLLWQARLQKILGITLGWTFLMALPSIVILPFPYISVSQRLLYWAGPPAALWWASVCVQILARVRVPALGITVVLGVMAMVLILPIAYIEREMVLHQLGLEPVKQLVSIARKFPDERHLVINPVNWVNYRQPWYALGHEGVSVSADYVDLSQLVRVNSGLDVEFVAATLTQIRADTKLHSYSTVNESTPWSWATFATQAPAFDHIWLVTYSDSIIAVEEVGSMRQGLIGRPSEYLASFDGGVFLVSATLDAQDHNVVVTLNWRFLAEIPDTTIFRHLYDCRGDLVGQGDGFAIGRMLSSDELASGTDIRDVRTIALDAMPDDGCYMLGIGLFRPNGSRVSAYAEDGLVFREREVLLSSGPSDDGQLEINPGALVGRGEYGWHIYLPFVALEGP